MPDDKPKKSRVTAEHKAEAARLKTIWDATAAARKARGVGTQERFGAEFNIGNQAAVGFFLNGITALSPKAAAGFARGLRCAVSDFSPRLAALMDVPPVCEETHPTLEGAYVGGPTRLVARGVSDPLPIISYPLKDWESILQTPLPLHFTLQMRDDSMAAPDGTGLLPGHYAEFSSQRTPTPNCVVLIADEVGNVFVRAYSEVRPGHWRAIARRPGYEPLDSIEHKLRLLAVQTGHRW